MPGRIDDQQDIVPSIHTVQQSRVPPASHRLSMRNSSKMQTLGFGDLASSRIGRAWHYCATGLYVSI